MKTSSFILIRNRISENVDKMFLTVIAKAS